MLAFLAFGKISEDFLNQALHIFVGFWVIMILVGIVFFGYVLLWLKFKDRSKPR